MKEKEINLPSLRRFKSSRLCFFSPLKILQVTELAADVSSLKHPLELLVVDHELKSSSMRTLSISLRGPAAKQGDENWSIDSLNCCPPRKSLVKGERFVRYEGKPEFSVRGM